MGPSGAFEPGAVTEPLLRTPETHTSGLGHDGNGEKVSRLKRLYACLRDRPSFSRPDRRNDDAQAYSALLLEKVKDKKRCAASCQEADCTCSLPSWYSRCF